MQIIFFDFLWYIFSEILKSTKMQHKIPKINHKERYHTTKDSTSAKEQSRAIEAIEVISELTSYKTI